MGKIYYTRRLFTQSTADEVLSDLSFEVKPGERVALIGPNGSGKSTTIKILSGIIQPTIGLVPVEEALQYASAVHG